MAGTATPDFTPSPHLFPFKSRWFESSVGPVHYVDEGTGETILFLHGNPTWSFLYRKIIGQLRGGFRCIAVDYPGFGLSVRPDNYGYTPREHASVVHEFVEHLRLERVVIMGQDWGGPIGLSVATRAPDRVPGLVMGNTWFWPTDRLMNKLFSWTLSTPPMRWAMLERNLFVERLLPAGMATTLSHEEMEHYRRVQPDRAARLGVAEFPRQLVAASAWLDDLAESVKERVSHKPLLLVWGMKDFAFKPGWALPHWEATFSERTVVELPHARHFIQEDAPDEIVSAITDWLPHLSP